jgi:ATP-dependent HslUV protease subunit HslV
MAEYQSGVIRATTILAVRKDGRCVMAGDGQVTLGDTIMKHRATKVRRMYDDNLLVGFAGAAADAFNLFERLEGKLESCNGNLTRAAVELAKDWRTDRYLRHLEAMMIVMDDSHTLVLSGTGDVVEPDEGVIAIGSGGSYAMAAGRALMRHTEMSAAEIARAALGIAGEICVYTNDQIVLEEVPA